MFFSKLSAISVGPLWALRRQAEAPIDICHTSNNCSVCGKQWITFYAEESYVVVIVASPIADNAQQKLLENCLLAAGWSTKFSYFSLHLNCSSNSGSALLALEEHIAAHPPELILVLGSNAGHWISPEIIIGQLNRFANIPLIVTPHPQEILLNPSLKAQIWADFCLMKLNA
ncbi:MAG: Uracil glycosylase superfamily [Solimicrobium sp.]|jgi:hypothetical protein|nr:Uracil glycosylase superfamily [Solimicrobium sp.]